MTSGSERAELRERLEADRARTREAIASLTRNFTSIVEASELTATDDEHDPEGQTIAFERSQASALLDSSRSRLAELEEALERLAEDRYGLCEGCGRAIPHARLLVRPAARTCVDCAGARSRGR